MAKIIGKKCPIRDHCYDVVGYKVVTDCEKLRDVDFYVISLENDFVVLNKEDKLQVENGDYNSLRRCLDEKK